MVKGMVVGTGGELEVAGDQILGGVGEIQGLAIHDRDANVGENRAGHALAQAVDHAWREVGGEGIGAPACGFKGDGTRAARGVQDVGIRTARCVVEDARRSVR